MYRLYLVEEEKMSKEFLSQNVANTQLSLRFSTNTIMKYKEVQVVNVISYVVLWAYAGCRTSRKKIIATTHKPFSESQYMDGSQ